MRKAIMYMLLALGIVLGVMFVGGALAGFAAGFIDGWNDAAPGSVGAQQAMACMMAAMAVLVCGLLQWVFLRWGFASYDSGRVPSGLRTRVLTLLLIVMGGMAFVYALVYNPLAEPDGTVFTESDPSTRDVYLWIKTHPLLSLPFIILVEATAALVLYGGVLREILAWKHRPHIVIPLFAAAFSAFTFLSGNVALGLPSMMVALVEAWTYETTRSVIPVIIGDAFFWVVLILMLGQPLPWWGVFIAAAVIVPAAYKLGEVMDTFKPID